MSHHESSLKQTVTRAIKQLSWILQKHLWDKSTSFSSNGTLAYGLFSCSDYFGFGSGPSRDDWPADRVYLLIQHVTRIRGDVSSARTACTKLTNSCGSALSPEVISCVIKPYCIKVKQVWLKKIRKNDHETIWNYNACSGSKSVAFWEMHLSQHCCMFFYV